MAKTVNTEDESFVTVKLPKDPNEDARFVALNGKTYMIKRGVNVKVPRGVAEILMNGSRAEEFADAFIASKAEQ